MNEQKVKLERSELLPKIALVAGEHLDGPITIEVPVLDNNFNYWYVGVGINTIFLLYLKTTRKCARQTERPQSTGGIFTGTGTNRKRCTGELRQLSHLFHRPAYTGEKRGTCRPEL